jgi:hypothetical protein
VQETKQAHVVRDRLQSNIRFRICGVNAVLRGSRRKLALMKLVWALGWAVAASILGQEVHWEICVIW